MNNDEMKEEGPVVSKKKKKVSKLRKTLVF